MTKCSCPINNLWFKFNRAATSWSRNLASVLTAPIYAMRKSAVTFASDYNNILPTSCFSSQYSKIGNIPTQINTETVSCLLSAVRKLCHVSVSWKGGFTYTGKVGEHSPLQPDFYHSFRKFVVNSEHCVRYTKLFKSLKINGEHKCPFSVI